ncbi:MAG: hypothetical protein FJ009_20735 [Chloroflexi bacterium]|nr:hypothetical protein [Chloroflexota bacterium]
MKIGMKVLIALVLVALLATPALADGPRTDDHVCFGGNTTVTAEESPTNVVLFGCNGRIQKGAQVKRDVVVFGGNLVLEEGTLVGHDVVVFGGIVQLAGEVKNEVVVGGGNVTLEPTAVVNGDLNIFGGSLDRKEGAVVRGKIERNGNSNVRWNWASPTVSPFRDGWNFFDSAFGWFFKNLINTLALAALGALIIVFLPTQLNQVATVAQKSAAPSLGVGCLTWLIVPPLAILFAITCLGIPLTLVLAIAFIAAIVLGWVAISVIIGDKLLNALKAKTIVPILALVVGLIVLWLITSLPILGALIWLFVATLAVGAVVLTRFGTRAYPPVAPVPVAPVAPALPAAPVAPSAPTQADDASANI